jgi:hypothetical protein
MSAAEQLVFAGQGPIFMGDYDATNGQAAQGYLTNLKRIGCGNRTLKIALSREKGKVKESCSGQALTLKTWTKGQEAMITLEMVQFSRDELAIALYGTSASVAGSTVTNEQMPTVAVGDYVHTKHPGISSYVLTDSAGTPATLVEGTHYEIDSAAHGRVKILSLGAFTQPFKQAYAHSAYGRVTAFTGAATRKGIIFDGVNVAEGNDPVRVIVPLIDFDPTKDFNWLSQDEVTLALEGEILYADALVNDTAFGAFFKVDALPV